MNADQARLARMALRLQFGEAAKLCDVAVGTIQRIEKGDETVKILTTRKVRAAYEKAGIDFIDDGKGFGVRLRRTK